MKLYLATAGEYVDFPASIHPWPPENGKIFATCRHSGCPWTTEVTEAELVAEAWRHAEMHTTRCSHANAVPVETGGETVAALCPDCDLQLPAAWLSCDHEGMSIEVGSFDEWRPPPRRLCGGCGVVYLPEAP